MARTLALPRIVLVMHALRPYTISQVFELPPGLPFPQPLDLSRGVVSFFASPMRPRRPAAAQPAPLTCPVRALLRLLWARTLCLSAAPWRPRAQLQLQTW